MTLAGALDDLWRNILIAVEQIEGMGLGSGSQMNLDFRREARKGVPEVIMAGNKRPEQIVESARSFLTANGRALISRVDSELLALLQKEFAEYCIDAYPVSGMVVLRQVPRQVEKSGGRVGIITAGTSDVAVAEQAQIIASEMGCEVLTAYDVGVAGLHRLFRPLKAMLEASVDVLIVAAGMDGALPSVVAGLVDIPVIGLPVSTGYGLGGGGVTALLSMLQTCSPGLAVVNIDNGIGAGAIAALIANRVARARGQSSGQQTKNGSS